MIFIIIITVYLHTENAREFVNWLGRTDDHWRTCSPLAHQPIEKKNNKKQEPFSESHAEKRECLKLGACHRKYMLPRNSADNVVKPLCYRNQSPDNDQDHTLTGDSICALLLHTSSLQDPEVGLESGSTRSLCLFFAREGDITFLGIVATVTLPFLIKISPNPCSCMQSYLNARGHKKT